MSFPRSPILSRMGSLVAPLVAACSFDPQPLSDIRPDGATVADVGPDRDAGVPDGQVPDVGPPDSGVQCGDGLVAATEACDDGDTEAADGCSADCMVEPGWTCAGMPSQCSAIVPEVSVIGGSASEGELLPFRFELSQATAADVTIEWETQDGRDRPAEAGTDYVSGSGSVTLLAGSLTETVNVETLDDLEIETIETVQVVLSTAAGALIDLGTATGTIAGPPLVDDGVVVRYFLDEQLTGEPPDDGFAQDALLDEPVDLTFTLSDTGPDYLTSPYYDRGLWWDDADSTGWVGAPVQGTKIATRLDGTQTMTMEALVDIRGAGDFSRIIHLGGVNDRGAMSLIVSPTTIQFLRDGEDNIVWNEVITNRGVLLLTLTFDTRALLGRRDVSLYIDGTLSDETPSGLPAFSEQINITGGDALLIGNRESADRAFTGWVGYVALYDEALTETTVFQNAQRLRARDDSGLP